MKKLFGFFDVRPKYIFHILLISASLFPAYFIGNFLFNFGGVDATDYLMWLWFGAWIFLVDNFLEEVFDL